MNKREDPSDRLILCFHTGTLRTLQGHKLKVLNLRAENPKIEAGGISI